MEELDALLTEGIFNHRWILLEAYHEVGKRVVTEKLDILAVARATRQRPKTIHFCKELYLKYPDINSVPDGKTVSWYKITKTLLPYEKDQAKKDGETTDK